MSFLEDCRKLVGLESTPTHGNLDAAKFVGRLCEEAGLHVEYQLESLGGVDQCNLIARPRGGRPESEVVLQTHLDTAHAGHFSHWTRTQSNPFNASIYDDLMYGLGCADVKLDVLCKLEAVKHFVGRELRTPFALVATFGGKTGMAGAIKLIRRKKLNAKFALVGYPTGMRLVGAGTGLAVVEIAIPFSEEEKAYRRDHDLLESTTTQSRMFGGRDNAIMKMMEYLAQLPDGIAVMDLDGGVDPGTVPTNAVLEIDTVGGFRDPILPKISRIFAGLHRLEQSLHAFRQADFEPPHATINLGMVRTLAEEILITGTCRLPPAVNDATYEGWMRELNTCVEGVGATFRVKDYRKGFTTAAESPFATTAQSVLNEMGLDAKLHKLAVVSEANVFTRLGIECLVWGPGQSVGYTQAPNESVGIGDLKTATEFYKRMIERLCV